MAIELSAEKWLKEWSSGKTPFAAAAKIVLMQFEDLKLRNRQLEEALVKRQERLDYVTKERDDARVERSQGVGPWSRADLIELREALTSCHVSQFLSGEPMHASEAREDRQFVYKTCIEAHQLLDEILEPDEQSNVERPNLSPESLIEWASSWVPEADRARFAEALASELRAGSAPKMDVQDRDAIIEECAKVAWQAQFNGGEEAENVANVLRGLKGSASPPKTMWPAWDKDRDQGPPRDEQPKVPQHGEKT